MVGTVVGVLFLSKNWQDQNTQLTEYNGQREHTRLNLIQLAGVRSEITEVHVNFYLHSIRRVKIKQFAKMMRSISLE